MKGLQLHIPNERFAYYLGYDKYVLLPIPINTP